MAKHLLIVEDDELVQQLMAAYLQSSGFRVSCVDNGVDMLNILSREKIDLVLLDLGLPDEDGLVLTRQLRARSTTPLMILTARTERDDRLAALELGADDYLTKPFDPDEIVLRVRNLLRRAEGSEEIARSKNILEFDGWELDTDAHSLTAPDGRDVMLTPSELKTLQTLAHAPNRVLSRGQLLDAISGTGDTASERMIDVLISRLRKKIERDPNKPALIKTVTGVGYKFDGTST